jgi:hypothetical protein
MVRTRARGGCCFAARGPFPLSLKTHPKTPWPPPPTTTTHTHARIADCFPKLEELDLSYNRLTGTLPEALTKLPLLSEAKFEFNRCADGGGGAGQ